MEVFIYFFFQAEDGIRDAQESRGLGDVYKRQAGGVAVAAAAGAVHTLSSRNFNAYDANFALLPCAKEHGCDASQIPSDLSAQLDRARLEQRIAIGGYLAGGVLIATGAVLLY